MRRVKRLRRSAFLIALKAAFVMDQMELRLAARKVAELEQVERSMRDKLREADEGFDKSEEHLRDLFDEAPIAYVQERLDTRLIQANRAAMKILGSDEICRKISQNCSPAGVTSPFVARAIQMAAAPTSCRSAGERAGVCQPHLGPVYLRVSAACLPNFFKSRTNVSRSFFERTLATSSIAAACSLNPRLISARPLGVSSTLRTRRSSG